jgi:hypothetical protein
VVLMRGVLILTTAYRATVNLQSEAIRGFKFWRKCYALVYDRIVTHRC